MSPLLSFMFEYLGILTAPEKVAPEKAVSDAPPVEMLVMRNLFDGCKNLRMLDIKIGEKTASAGWYGKSKAKAMYRSLIDSWTNSACQGFRLAGFNGPPNTFSSRRPLRDVLASSTSEVFSEQTMHKMEKKALRIVFSVMKGWEMLMHLTDMHEVDYDPSKLATLFSPDEIAEIVLHELALRLHNLALACRAVPVPQKWVGSSVALAFDTSVRPSREDGEAVVRQGVKVNIFDWGRSELNTVENHHKLSDEEKHDRDHYWQNYVGGVDRLAWETARAYRNRFGNADGWESVEVTLYDYDSTKYDDFIGKVVLPFKEASCETAEFTPSESWIPIASPLSSGSSSGPVLTYSIERREMPTSSRIADSWRFIVHSASKIPSHDLARGKSDPYVVLVAVSSKGNQRFRQQTSVKQADLDPVWEESFDFLVAQRAGVLEAGLSASSTNTAAEPPPDIPGLPPPPEAGGPGADKEEEQHLLDWETYLNSIAGTAAGVRGARTGSQLSSAMSSPSRVATTMISRMSTLAVGMFRCGTISDSPH